MAARKLLIADLLCGAGGSTTGAIRALLELGWSLEDIILTCVNHWPVAIDTHQRNHPVARHFVQDIAVARPHIIVPEGYLDLLMASPTCTHHSVARGGKPTSDQQRSDPWHIITWLTELRVKRIIIENVWEFIGWGPVDVRTGKPVQSRKGEYFRAWIDTIRRLGFDPEWRKLNAADYGDATTRSRFILMARSDRRSISWPVPTHRRREEARQGQGALELFPGMQTWRPARDIIDWSIKGRSIFGRPKPLAPKTLARILAGAIKFRWPAPFIQLLIQELAHSLAFHIRQGFAARNAKRAAKERTKRRAQLRALIAWLRRSRSETGPHALSGVVPDPMLITLRRNGAGSDIARPIPTVAANGTHIGLAQPVIVNMKGRSTASSASEPLPTQTAQAPHLFSAEPVVLSQHGSGAPRSTSDPLPTITTGGAGAEDRVGCARPMLVEPFVVTAAHGVDAGDRHPHSRRVKSVGEPLGTLHAGGGKFGVVEPFMLSRHAEGGPRSTDDPTPTQVAKHSHLLISPYYGSGSGETCTSGDDPLPTATAKARFGMVIPITHSDGSNRARDVDADPLPTVTTANRGELAFITAQHGERPGQAPRVHDIGAPAPTIAATGHVDLVEPTPEFDVLFRMLEPPELAAAMGFSDEEQAYEFAGTKTEQVKQIGNAVSVRKMRACVREIMADAARPRAAAPAALPAVEQVA